MPAGRMKAKRQHRVPLATQAMEALTEARRLANDSRRPPDGDRWAPTH